MQWTGTGNGAWPIGTCPADGGAGHRRNLMDATMRYIGVGVWGLNGNLINARPFVQVHDFADTPTAFYPAARVYSGSHIFIGEGSGENMQTLQFFVSWLDAAAPSRAQLWLAGAVQPLTCDQAAGWGAGPQDCVYRSAVMLTTGACRLCESRAPMHTRA